MQSATSRNTLHAALCLSIAGAALPSTAYAQTVINGLEMSRERLQQLRQATGVAAPAGRFWYDARSGLWGAEGGPALGFTRPGLDVGATLPADASRGRTGVFMNGRQLHEREVRWLQTLGPVWPGRYWLDPWGNVGFEGQPTPFVNLTLLTAQRNGASNSVTRSGTWIASEGGCVIVAAKSSGGIGSFGASSC
jgi:hypothetical protein